MIIFPLITTWMWFEAAMAVQSLSNNTLRKLVAGPTARPLYIYADRFDRAVETSAMAY
jgi:hypothetical protein